MDFNTYILADMALLRDMNYLNNKFILDYRHVRISDSQYFENSILPLVAAFDADSEPLSLIPRKNMLVYFETYRKCYLSFLQNHFSNFLVLPDESGNEYYFRFSDPLVITSFLQSCEKHELDMFFGPVKSFFCFREDESFLFRFYLRERKLFVDDLPLSADITLAKLILQLK